MQQLDILLNVSPKRVVSTLTINWCCTLKVTLTNTFLIKTTFYIGQTIQYLYGYGIVTLSVALK